MNDPKVEALIPVKVDDKTVRLRVLITEEEYIKPPSADEAIDVTVIALKEIV